jgi:hypothetical protein
MEEGRSMCEDSTTLNEEWIKEIVRNRVEKILIFNDYVDICYNNEEKLNITLKYK